MNKVEGSPKETTAEPAPQSSDIQHEKVADSQTKTTAYRIRESPKQRNTLLTIAQIEDMHFYDISIKMELRHMEHQTKIFIKEAKETQELFMKLEKERAG